MWATMYLSEEEYEACQRAHPEPGNMQHWHDVWDGASADQQFETRCSWNLRIWMNTLDLKVGAYWRNYSLLDQNISTQFTSSVYVFSDTVLCLCEKCQEHPAAASILEKEHIRDFGGSPQYQRYSNVTGMPMEFVWSAWCKEQTTPHSDSLLSSWNFWTKERNEPLSMCQDRDHDCECPLENTEDRRGSWRRCEWNRALSTPSDEQHSQRMTELLRRGVLEPSLAYAFLMTEREGNGSVAGRRRVQELRLFLTRHRHVSSARNYHAHGVHEGRNDGTLYCSSQGANLAQE